MRNEKLEEKQLFVFESMNQTSEEKCWDNN